jgi:hypothetical protein
MTLKHVMYDAKEERFVVLVIKRKPTLLSSVLLLALIFSVQ